MYRLGKGSLRELEGVHPQLQGIVKTVITRTPVDFSVHDGIRTEDEQRGYVEAGVSWTMNSKHLPQEDGFGHAVDLVPYINKRLRWEWPPLYKIAEVVREVATEQNVPIRWGGCWQVITGTTESLEDMVEAYAARKRAEGKKPSLDGPHFELRI